MIEYVFIEPKDLVEFYRRHREDSFTRWQSFLRWLRHRTIISVPHRREWTERIVDYARQADIEDSDIRGPITDLIVAPASDIAPGIDVTPVDPFCWEERERHGQVDRRPGPEICTMVELIARRSGVIRIIDRYALTDGGGLERLVEIVQSIGVEQRRLKTVEIKLARQQSSTASRMREICDRANGTEFTVIELPKERFQRDGHDRFIAGYSSEGHEGRKPRWCFMLGQGLRCLTSRADATDPARTQRHLVAAANPQIFADCWNVLAP